MAKRKEIAATVRADAAKLQVIDVMPLADDGTFTSHGIIAVGKNVTDLDIAAKAAENGMTRTIDVGQVVRVTYQPGEPSYSREFLVYNSSGDRLGAWQLQLPRDAAAADLAGTPGLELLLTDRREGVTSRKLLVAGPGLAGARLGPGPRPVRAR